MYKIDDDVLIAPTMVISIRPIKTMGFNQYQFDPFGTPSTENRIKII